MLFLLLLAIIGDGVGDAFDQMKSNSKTEQNRSKQNRVQNVDPAQADTNSILSFAVMSILGKCTHKRTQSGQVHAKIHEQCANNASSATNAASATTRYDRSEARVRSEKWSSTYIYPNALGLSVAMKNGRKL